MKIEHVAIWVKDLERMKLFYQKYFHATSGSQYNNVRKGFHSYFLSFSKGARLELMNMNSIPENKNNAIDQFIGINHLAISVGDIETVNTLTNTLRNDGYNVVGEPRWTGDGYYESVILDPEENRIEITV